MGAAGQQVDLVHPVSHAAQGTTREAQQWVDTDVSINSRGRLCGKHGSAGLAGCDQPLHVGRGLHSRHPAPAGQHIAQTHATAHAAALTTGRCCRGSEHCACKERAQATAVMTQGSLAARSRALPPPSPRWCIHPKPSASAPRAAHSHVGFAAQRGHVPASGLALLEGQVGSIAEQVAVDGAAWAVAIGEAGAMGAAQRAPGRTGKFGGSGWDVERQARQKGRAAGQTAMQLSRLPARSLLHVGFVQGGLILQPQLLCRRGIASAVNQSASARPFPGGAWSSARPVLAHAAAHCCTTRRSVRTQWLRWARRAAPTQLTATLPTHAHAHRACAPPGCHQCRENCSH